MVRYDIITLGSATVDVFAKTESGLVTIKTHNTKEELIAYPSGEKILIQDLQFLIGGGGTNTAVAFSRLGFRTAYAGCLGRDDNARKVLELLKKEKVDFIGTTENAKTNYSIVLDSIEEDRTILVFKDASDKLDYNKLNLKKFRAKWLYSSSLLEQSFRTLENLTEYAKKNNMNVAFNPSNYQAEWGISRLSRILKNLEILILNKEEAELLAGKGETPYLLKALQKAGPKIVVITDGKNGADAIGHETIYTIKPNKVKIVETTGAGDAFAAGFVAGIMMNKGIEFALRLAILNAESVITNYGAKNILLKKSNALKMMKIDKRKILKHKV